MKELSNCNSILVEHNNKVYAFDYINYEIMELNTAQVKIFEYMINEKSISDISAISDLIPIMLKIKTGVFFTENPVKLYAKEKKSGFGIISFPVVHACNLRCKYCFAKSGNNYTGTKKCFNIDTLYKAYEYLAQLFDKPLGAIRLEFVSGGETLLNQSLLKDLISQIRIMTNRDDVKLEVFAMTNGTLLNQDIIDFLHINNSKLGISIDGPAYLHNYHRPFKNGKGSYDIIIRNLKEMMNVKRDRSIWAVSVITSATNSLIDILNHHKSLGIISMEMRIVRGDSGDGITIQNDNLAHFKKLYYEFAEYLKEHTNDLIFILNDYDTFGKIVKRLLVGEKIIYRCQAGKNKFSFTADGDVYPCDSFVGCEQFKIGNVYNGEINNSIIDCFINMDVDHINKCESCEFRYLCGGDCYFNLLFNKQNHATCELQKYLCVLAVDLVYHIKNNDTKNFLRVKEFAKLRNILK